jgi:hypothetical protein
VWTGSEYGAVWCASTGTWSVDTIFFQRIARDGTPIGSPVPVSENAWRPSIAWTGREYAISFVNAGAANLAIVDPNGTVIDGPFPILSSGAVSETELMWNGSELAVAFTDRRTGSAAVYFAHGTFGTCGVGR